MPLPYSIVEQAATLTDRVIVGFSCGKDSVVALDLACKHFRRVHAYFMYLVDGLEIMETTLRWAQKKYGVEILRVPHVNVSVLIRGATFRTMTNKALECPQLTFREVEAHVAKHFGCKWFLYGHRMQESLQRRGMINHNGRIDIKNRTIYPLADWVPKMVNSHMALNDLPLPKIYAEFRQSFGSFSPEVIEYIKRTYPDDYNKIKAHYPFIDAVLLKYELEQRKNTAPKV